MTIGKHILKFHFIIYSTTIFLLSCNFSSWNRERSLYAGSIDGNIIIRDVEIEPAASRTSGVAPLSVHFTAGFSNSSSTVRDFHNLDYTWNFNDPGSGNWGTTGKSKNTAKSPVTTHIFETPGTYTVNLVIRNGITVIDTESFNIEVLDPDTVYGGTNTTCINNAGDTDFTGAPNGARTVSTNDLSGITQYATAGSRILFKRGSSWTTGGLSFPNNAGPVTLASYGTNGTMNALGIYDNAPLITVTGGSFCNLNNKQDWRITDLHLVNNDKTAGSLGGDYNMQRIILQHLRIEGFSTAIGWSHWNNDSNLMTIDQMVISDCDLKNSQSNVVYIGGERIALLGSIIQNSMDTHVARVWQAYLGVISNNIISGSSLDTDAGRHALKLHGPGYKSSTGVNEYGPPQVGTGLLENRTEFAVVSDNVFGSSGPWPVMITPQDELTNSLISDIIFERNRIITNFGEKSSRNVQIALHLTAWYITVRNNIFDGTGSDNDYAAIEIVSGGSQPAPLCIEVYNNTIYRSDNSTGFSRYGIIVSESATKTVVKNNLISFSGSLIPTAAIINNSTSLIEQSNLLTGSPGFIAPDNSYGSDPYATNFNLNSGSPAINTGTDVPVYEDINNVERPVGIYDIGAYEN